MLVYVSENNVKLFVVVVLDVGGYVVVFKCQDGVSLYCGDIVNVKVKGVFGMGFNIWGIVEKVKNNLVFFNSLIVIFGIEIVLLLGGNLIKVFDGILFGVIGISGDIGDVDE